MAAWIEQQHLIHKTIWVSNIVSYFLGSFKSLCKTLQIYWSSENIQIIEMMNTMHMIKKDVALFCGDLFECMCGELSITKGELF